MLAVSAITAIVISTITYNIYSDNQEIKDRLKKTAEVKVAKEKIDLNSQHTKTGQTTTANIKLSELSEKLLSPPEKEKLDNFQKAITQLVLAGNENPTCTQIADTNLITLESCNSLKEQNNNFVKINNGSLEIEDEKISSIIDNTNHFKTKMIDENGKTTFKIFDTISLKRDIAKTKKEIKSQNQIEEIIINTEDEELLRDLGEVLVEKTNPTQTNFIQLAKIEKISNRLKEVELKKELENITNEDEKAEKISDFNTFIQTSNQDTQDSIVNQINSSNDEVVNIIKAEDEVISIPDRLSSFTDIFNRRKK